ncbi:MAG: RIP metalloprotease RseP, partial [Bacteroidia bacterium]|nr:RIP metalloprotease RseP [Bacteroidia bacterium]
GHFLPAKLFRMRVEKFYLFFDWPFKLLSWKRNGTEYGIGVLPLGGYVKIAGMADESNPSGRHTAPPQPDEFRSKPLYQRMLVVAGGPLANILYAFLILSGIFYFTGIQRIPLSRWVYGVEAVPEAGIQAGDQVLLINEEPAYLDKLSSPEWLLQETPTLTVLRGKDTIVLSISAAQRDSLLQLYARKEEDAIALRFPAEIQPLPGGPANQAGLQKGDIIQAVGNKPIRSFSELRQAIQETPSDQVRLLVRRGDSVFSVEVRLDSAHRIQVLPAVEPPREVQELPLFGALQVGIAQSYRLAITNLKALSYLITGKARLSDNLSGPIGIARAAGRTYESGGLRSFVAFTGALSLILAIMNLLPIPLLDGGHLLFLGLEAILRREPSPRLREIAQYVGLGLILALMVFALWNDLRRL